METIIMDVKEIASKIEEEIKQETKGCIIRPSVAVIEVGENSLSEKYMKAREDSCNKAGIYFRYYKFEDNTPELTIINKIKELNNDDYVNGISVSLPLPDKYNEKRLLNTIINSKDIDGITDINIGRLISGRKTIVPCAVLAIMELLKKYEVDMTDKNVVILGDNKLLGRPLANLLLNDGVTVTVCNSLTKNLKKFTKEADIIVSSLGLENLITGDMINEGAIVIDAGSLISDSDTGDIEYKTISKKSSLITPESGGITALIVAMFLQNTLLCYKKKNK